MRARRVHIRPRLPRDPTLLPTFKQRKAIISSPYSILTHPLDENTGMLILPDNQRPSIISIHEQVKQLLIVYLEEGAVHSEIVWFVLLLKLSQLLESRIYGAWNDTILLFIR